MHKSEHDIQAQFVTEFRLRYPTKLMFAIPNGGLRNPTTAHKLKVEGVLAGVPDIFIAHSTIDAAGLFLEFKTANGKISNAQEEIRTRLEKNGYWVGIVRTVEDALNLVNYYFASPSLEIIKDDVTACYKGGNK